MACARGANGKHASLGRVFNLPVIWVPAILPRMTAAKVIEEIKSLPREEQTQVIQFAFELARERQLSGKELSALAQRMVDSNDPAEVERLKAELTRGFYGE